MLTPAAALRAQPVRTAGASIPPQGWPLLRLGFRPFYLAASAWASLTLALWAATLAGWNVLPAALAAPRHPPLWHAHEMLLGFAATVVVGFVLALSQ